MKTTSQPFQAVSLSSSTGSCAIARAASTPVMPGMRMSRKTRSGLWASVSATASVPFFASATISSSGQTSASRARSCSRIKRSSSAISARAGRLGGVAGVFIRRS